MLFNGLGSSCPNVKIYTKIRAGWFYNFFGSPLALSYNKNIFPDNARNSLLIFC
jgi:hypothetical protein